MVFRFNSVKDWVCPGPTVPTHHLSIFKHQGSWNRQDGYLLHESSAPLSEETPFWAQVKVDDTRGTCLSSIPPACSTRRREVAATALPNSMLNPYYAGKAQLPEDLRALYKPKTHTSKTSDAKENRVCSSLLLSARWKSMSTGPHFWDRQPFYISAHTLPPGQHLAPTSPAVTSAVGLCGCPTKTAPAEVRCLFPLTHTKLMHGLDASQSNSNTGIVEVSPGKWVYKSTKDKETCICSPAGLSV